MTTHLQRQLHQLKHRGAKTTTYLDFVGCGSLRNADGDDDKLPCGGEKEIPEDPTETDGRLDPGDNSHDGNYDGNDNNSGGNSSKTTNIITDNKRIIWIALVIIVIVFLTRN